MFMVMDSTTWYYLVSGWVSSGKCDGSVVMVFCFIPRSHYRAITTIALIVSDRGIQAKTKISYDLTTVW